MMWYSGIYIYIRRFHTTSGKLLHKQMTSRANEIVSKNEVC